MKCWVSYLNPTYDNQAFIDELESGIEVLDVGCGAGRALNLMAEAFLKSNFTGYDISEEATATGRAAAEQNGLTNLKTPLAQNFATNAATIWQNLHSLQNHHIHHHHLIRFPHNRIQLLCLKANAARPPSSSRVYPATPR